jgi:glycogen debranching enzyme
MLAPTDRDLLDALLSDGGWAHASLPPTSPDDPGRFHALFGRDSLIFALQMLPEAPGIARGTLRTLAQFQGDADDDELDMEPGKIIHEYRPIAPDWLVAGDWPIRDGSLRYYGSADATSWFLVVLAALGEEATILELKPAWRAAAGWLERALDRGGGLVRSGPRTLPGGLEQQGWRDARRPAGHPHGGGIVRPDGSAPRAPLADADSQAVAVAALRALATLDGERAGYWRERAEALTETVSAMFRPDVVAVEADDNPVKGAGSQLGWLLWAEALDEASAQAAARRLCEPDVLTPFGLRTLSARSAQFRVDGYHRGSVWPFDSWLGWGGLRAQGRQAEAEAVRIGVLEAVERLGGAPEFYEVTRDGELRRAFRANRVQAWTLGAAQALRLGWDGRLNWW